MICLVHVKLCTNVRVYFIERFIKKKNVNGYIENDQKMIYQSHRDIFKHPFHWRGRDNRMYLADIRPDNYKKVNCCDHTETMF